MIEENFRGYTRSSLIEELGLESGEDIPSSYFRKIAADVYQYAEVDPRILELCLNMAADQIDRLTNLLELVRNQADAGLRLAEYASYSEIIGAVHHNRPQIREWCDKLIKALHAVEKAERGE